MRAAWIWSCSLALGGCELLGPYRDEPVCEVIPDPWPADALADCDTTRATYRVDQIVFPATERERDRRGWDFDGDGTSDNKGAGIISGIQTGLGVDLSTAPNETLAADLVHIGMTVERCAAPSYDLVSIHRGVSLDRTARPPRLFAEPVTEYAMVAGEEPGASALPLGTLIHPSVTAWADAPLAVTAIDRIGDDSVSGTLAAVFPQEAIDELLIPAAHAVIQDRVETGDPVAETLLGILDDDEDGEITLAEVQQNSLVMTLLRADVDTDCDGEEDALSLGVGFHASRVQLVVE